MPARTTLRTIVDLVREGGSDGILFPLLPGLESLNKYFREQHHSEDLGYAVIRANAEELVGFVHITLKITDCL